MMVMFFFFMDAYAKSNTIYIGQPEPRYEIRRLFLKIAVSIQLGSSPCLRPAFEAESKRLRADY